MKRTCAAVFLLLALAITATRVSAEPLTLEACIERALQHNNQVRLAEQGVRRSVANVKSARAQRLPNVNATLLNFSHSRTGPSVRIQENPTGELDPITGRRILREESTQIPAIDRNSYSFSTSVSQNLYDGGNNRHTHSSARRSLESSEKELEAQQATTIFNARQRFFNLLKAEGLVVVQRDAVVLGEKRLEEARARLEVGAGIKADVLRLQVQAENSQADLINAEQQVLLGRANLNHLMGAEIAEPLEIVPVTDIAPVDLATLSLPALVMRTQAQNPNMARLRFALDAAGHDHSAAKAAWHPRLNGSVSYSRNNEVFDRVYQDLDQNYRLNAGVNLTYNLFDGGIRSATIDRSRIGLEAARMNLEQERRDLALAVEIAYLELARLNKIVTINERTVELAQEDLRLAEESYRVGRGTLLELLDAQVGFTQARSNQISGRYDLVVAMADLERLTGPTADSDMSLGP